jgi:hypothetical protein
MSCSPKTSSERSLARLSAFAGGFGLDGAAAVLDDPDEMNVLDTVEALVDKSLLTVADIGGVRRYRYLETIRSYAEDRLQDRGDGDEVIDLMHRHLVAVVRDAVDELLRRSGRGADRLSIETPNLRRSVDDMIDRDDIDAAAELIVPYLPIAGAIDWRIAGWADELLSLPASPGSIFELELQMLSGLDAFLDGRFHDLNAILLRTKPVEQTGVVSDGVLYVMVLINVLIANYPAASRCVAIMHAQSDDTDLLLAARLTLYWDMYVPSPPGTHIALPP